MIKITFEAASFAGLYDAITRYLDCARPRYELVGSTDLDLRSTVQPKSEVTESLAAAKKKVKKSRPSNPKPLNMDKPNSKSEPVPPTEEAALVPGTTKLPSPTTGPTKEEVLAALKSIDIGDASKIVRSYEVNTVGELKPEWYSQIIQTVKSIKAQL